MRLTTVLKTVQRRLCTVRDRTALQPRVISDCDQLRSLLAKAKGNLLVGVVEMCHGAENSKRRHNASTMEVH
jgi:hypothetical protein